MNRFWNDQVLTIWMLDVAAQLYVLVWPAPLDYSWIQGLAYALQYVS